MPLTVTVTGGRAYITGDGFAFTATLSGTQADITGVGRTVTATFADPQADIKWSAQNYSISSGSYIVNFKSFHQFHMPGETDHSMKDITNLTGLYLGTNTASAYRGISFTSNYLFTCKYNGSVSRINLSTLVTNSTSAGSVIDTRMIAYSDDYVYVFGREDSSFVIYKVNPFTGEDTLVAQQTPDNVYRTFGCARVRNGTNDVMVCVGTTSDLDDDHRLFVMVFNLNNDSVINSQVIQPTNAHMRFNQNAGAEVFAQSGNIVAFNATEQYGDDITAGDSFCKTPLVVVNIINGIATLVELPIYTYPEDPDTLIDETWGGSGYIASAVDTTNGDLYYWSYLYNYDTVETTHYIRKASQPAYSPPSVPWDYGDLGTSAPQGPQLAYGDGGTIGFRFDNVSGEFVRITRPNQTALLTLDASQKGNYGSFDDENEMYWIVDCDNDQLTGLNYGTGSNRNITIDSWGATSPPAGLFGRKLFMFNGYAVVSGCTNESLGGTEHFWFLYPTVGSASISISPSASISISPSTSGSPSPSGSRSKSPSASRSRSVSPSRSNSPSLSPSQSASRSQSPSRSASPSASGSPSLSPSASESISPSESLSPSASGSPSLSPSGSLSQSASGSPSASGSASPSPSAAGGDVLLLETGDALLLESGDKLLLE